MPRRYKTYRRSKRRFGYKKRVSRRFKRRSYKRARVSDSTVYRFSRTFEFDIDGPSTNSSVVSNMFAIRLSSVPAFTEFTALFEEYKITKCKFEFMPRQGFQYAGNVDHGIFHIWNDYDDNTAPGATEYLQKSDVKHWNLSTNAKSKMFHTLLPRYQVPVYRTGVTFGYMPKKGSWISTVNDDVQYYGTKWIWKDAALANGTIVPRIHANVKVYFKFRRPK